MKKSIKLDEQDIQTIEQLAKFVISLQRSGKYVPGHVPLSGVFASCSIGCSNNCLSDNAHRLLGNLEIV